MQNHPQPSDPTVTTVQLAGLDISAVTMLEALRMLERFTQDGAHHYLCFCEANLLREANRSKRLQTILRQADLTLPDGVALTLMARLKHAPLPGRIPGPTFLLAACEYGVTHGWRHYFYGGQEGVAQRLADRLQSDYPGLQVAGTCCPPFRELDKTEELKIKHEIEQAHPHLLWVGLGGPKQEYWMAAHVQRLNVPVMLGVGAAFDFHSGNRPWAPAIVRRAGLEWLFRMFTGGRRTFTRNCGCVSVTAALLGRELLRQCIPRQAKSSAKD